MAAMALVLFFGRVGVSDVGSSGSCYGFVLRVVPLLFVMLFRLYVSLCDNVCVVVAHAVLLLFRHWFCVFVLVFLVCVCGCGSFLCLCFCSRVCAVFVSVRALVLALLFLLCVVLMPVAGVV